MSVSQLVMRSVRGFQPIVMQKGLKVPPARHALAALAAQPDFFVARPRVF